MIIPKSILSVKQFFWKNRNSILVLLVVAVIHFSYLPNGFTWLDHNDIEEGHGYLPFNEVYKAFILPFGETSFYRPVVVILNSIDHTFYGNWPIGYHVTN